MRDVASESLESLRDKRVMAKLVAEAEKSAFVRDARAARAQDVTLAKDVEVENPNGLRVENEGSPPIFPSGC